MVLRKHVTHVVLFQLFNLLTHLLSYSAIRLPIHSPVGSPNLPTYLPIHMPTYLSTWLTIHLSDNLFRYTLIIHSLFHPPGGVKAGRGCGENRWINSNDFRISTITQKRKVDLDFRSGWGSYVLGLCPVFFRGADESWLPKKNWWMAEDEMAVKVKLSCMRQGLISKKLI